MGSDRLSSYNYKLYAGYLNFNMQLQWYWVSWLGICFAFDRVNSLQVFRS